MPFDFLNLTGTAVGKLAIAGALGGVVRWLTLKEKWTDGLVSVVVGAITSVYVGPAAFPLLKPLIDFAGVEHEAAVGLSGFLIGVGGILVSGFLIDVWRARRKMLKAGFVVAPPDTHNEEGQP